MSKKQKIIVGMSGGVDSSVAAVLLKKQGHEVKGVYMKNWTDDKFTDCPWQEDVEYANKTAEKLGIDFEVWDFQKEYYQSVVEYFFREYKSGRTPNPDIMCNLHIKFGVFLDRVIKEGFDFVATGHYVRKRGNKLLAGMDKNKDQSYFLYTMTQSQLKRSMFPLGDITKEEVRKLAKDLDLPAAGRKDSTGICFIGEVEVRKFLQTKIKPHPGEVVTTDGEVIGQHEGVEFYTIGQRHGLGVPGGSGPYFVVEKNTKRNQLIVVEGEDDPALFSKGLVASNLHWISGTEPEFPLNVSARIRYRQPRQETVVRKEGKSLRVEFAGPQRAVTPGQAVVFYKDDEVLGGAVIEKSL